MTGCSGFELRHEAGFLRSGLFQTGPFDRTEAADLLRQSGQRHPQIEIMGCQIAHEALDQAFVVDDQLPFGAALQPAFARVIAKLRGPSVRRNYARIGGGSPQLWITQQQAASLEDTLSAARPGGGRYRVFIAMRYSRPTCEEARTKNCWRG